MYLQKLKEDYNDRVHVYDAGYSPYEDDNISDFLTKAVSGDSWPQKPPLKVILPLSPLKETWVTMYLLNQFTNQTGLFSCGRTELYLSTSYYLAACIAADYSAKNYRNYQFKSVLIQTLFDTEILGKTPWEEFDPKVLRKKSKRKKNEEDYFDDCHNAFLIKLTPKLALPELIPIESLHEYAFFVRQSMIRRKTNYIIPYFE